MSRPPYLRRAAAFAVLVAAVVIEFRPVTTERLPIAAIDLPAGSTVTEADVEWFAVQGGIDTIQLPSVLSRSVAAGSPISPADVDATSIEVPADWLEIELDVPSTTQRGAAVVAVMSPSTLDRPAIGVVTQPPDAAGFDTPTAMVAFAPSEAVAVAHAVAHGTVTVLLGR